MADIIITNGTIITMDSDRQIIPDGALVIEGDRITDVGPTALITSAHVASRVINAEKKVILPGLIDVHGHAGHSLVKTMDLDNFDRWLNTVEYIYSEGTDEEFWYAESLLASLERLKFGTTCGVTYFGGGRMVIRTDDPIYADRHCQAVQEVGIRELLAVGPSSPPFPRQFARWHNNTKQKYPISFDQHIQTTEEIIRRWHEGLEGNIQICLTSSTQNIARLPYSDMPLSELRSQSMAVKQLAAEHGLLLTQDGHTTGTVKFAHEKLDILGPEVLLSHSTGLTEEEIQICADTDTKIAHNPSSPNSYQSRCPVPQLLEAGVTVGLGSDAASPDMNYDMFRHMYSCMRQHRAELGDGTYMPPGKVLEMATIDAASALGLADDLGSLESGKKADVILIDMSQPHLYPLNMPVHRIVNFANGHDVDTVIVNGKVLMEGRQVRSINELDVLNRAQKATDTMLDRTGLRSKLNIPNGFWGRSKYPNG